MRLASIFVLVFTLFLVSCNTSSMTFLVSKKSPVNGVVASHIEIVEQPYKIEFEKMDDRGEGWHDYQAYINLNIKILNNLSFDRVSKHNFYIEFYDENDIKCVNEIFKLEGREKRLFIEFLKKGNGMHLFRLNGSSCDGEKDYFKNEDWSKIKYIKIQSDIVSY